MPSDEDEDSDDDDSECPGYIHRTYDDINSDPDSDDESVEHTIYEQSKSDMRRRIDGRNKGRTMEPLPYTGTSKEFKVDISDDELKALFDANGDIYFERVFDWLLPRFGNDEEIL